MRVYNYIYEIETDELSFEEIEVRLEEYYIQKRITEREEKINELLK